MVRSMRLPAYDGFSNVNPQMHLLDFFATTGALWALSSHAASACAGRAVQADLARALGPCLLAAQLVACEALATPEVRLCRSDSDCGSQFGFTSTCAESGYCEALSAVKDIGQPRVDEETPYQACSVFPEDLWDERHGEYRDAIVFGYMKAKDRDADSNRLVAAKIAIKEANKALSEHAHRFGLAVCDYDERDDNDDAASDHGPTAEERASVLLDSLTAPVILGPSRSRDALSVVNSLRAQGLDTVVISPAATSADLKPAATDSPFWRTVPHGRHQVLRLQRLAVEAEVQEMVPLNLDVTGKDNYAKEFREDWPDEVPLATSKVYKSVKDISKVVSEIDMRCSSSTCALLFISTVNHDQDAFIEAIAKKGPRRVFFTSSAANGDLLAALNKHKGVWEWAERCMLGTQYRTAGADQSEVYRDFEGRFQAATRDSRLACGNTCLQNDAHIARTYDATWLAIHGAIWSAVHGSVTGSSIRAAFEELNAEAAGSAAIFGPSYGFGLGLKPPIGASGPLRYEGGELAGTTEELVEVWQVKREGEGPSTRFHFVTCHDLKRCLDDMAVCIP